MVDMSDEEIAEFKRSVAENMARKNNISLETAEARMALVGGSVARKFGDAPPLTDEQRDELMRKAGWA
jgi:predicted metal-binding transcription factor (methanogenesis marker protein 9)